MLRLRQSQRGEIYRDLEDGDRQTDRRERTGRQRATEKSRECRMKKWRQGAPSTYRLWIF